MTSVWYTQWHTATLLYSITKFILLKYMGNKINPLDVFMYILDTLHAKDSHGTILIGNLISNKVSFICLNDSLGIYLVIVRHHIPASLRHKC